MSHRLYLGIFISSFFLGACSGESDLRRPPLRSYVPNTEQIALVNGEPLSLDRFMLVHESMGAASPEDAFWVSTAALALQSGWPDPAPSLVRALDLALYAKGLRSLDRVRQSVGSIPYFTGPRSEPSPDQVRKFLEKKLQAANVVRNEAIWAGLFQKK